MTPPPIVYNTHNTQNTMFTVTLKRSQWECYTDTPDSVIATINGYFSRILTDKPAVLEAQREIYHFLSMYTEWGFSDSECHQAATDVINKYYKTSIDRWECMKAGWAAKA